MSKKVQNGKILIISFVIVMLVLAVLVIWLSKSPDTEAESMTGQAEKNAEQTMEQVTENAAETVVQQDYPSSPVYVRTMGTGSVGCEYGYCALGEKTHEEMLKELSGWNGFYNSPENSADVALFYTEEPQDIKLYHMLEDSTEYEEYEFAGENYRFPWGATEQKYVICVPQEYGTHYFFGVITWQDGSKDLIYFSMKYASENNGEDAYGEVEENQEKQEQYENLGVYKDFYEKLSLEYSWPDGEKLSMSGDVLGGFNPEGNSFAIYDIDEDGSDEIIVNYTTTYSAGMVTRIYDYDSESGAYIKQFGNYVQNTYYDNGIILAYASHNHTNGERVWPYELYKYNRESDKYEIAASVCSEDKRIVGDAFDEALDTDGDGVLYLITLGDRTSSDTMTVNKDEYEKWINSYLVDGEVLKISWQTLVFE